MLRERKSGGGRFSNLAKKLGLSPLNNISYRGAITAGTAQLQKSRDRNGLGACFCFLSANQITYGGS